MSVDLEPICLSFGSRSISARPSNLHTVTTTSTLHNDIDPPSTHFRDSPTLRASSPSSSMTARRFDAYPSSPALPDDEPFPPVHRPTRTLRRRSSRVSRWLLELQSQSTPSSPSDVLDLSDVLPVGTQCNPYLAYPHMSMAAVRRSLDDADSMHDYVVVDDDLVQECPQEGPLHAQESRDPSAPADTANTIRLINAPQSLRHSHLSTPSPTIATTRTPSRLSIFQRSSRGNSTSAANSPSRHARTASTQTSLFPHALSSLEDSHTHSSRWRPSVLGHFSSPSVPGARLAPGDSLTDRSRPSMSSTNTCSSFTTPTTTTMYEDGDSPAPSSTPSKSSSIFGSLRARSHTDGTSFQSFFKSDSASASSPALRPLPASALHLPERRPTPSSLARKASMIRLPFATKSRSNQSWALNQILVEEPDDSHPRVLFTGKHNGPRMSLSSRQAKKKKLVISGIPLGDTRRLEAVQRWCQSFGEVDQITRMPNGDLHVNFQKAEVADTVCRVRAKVQIAGVGSVHLSWITGKQRT
ncbi:hypothetical protein PAXRUDRAFT_820995 [Paxillus rubicundulus Ve08.2h10]|uniref:RRM domain-containing protein n=1 Tax=Paxillus rubicundulus Ve08.2h10 TaxID=930991 RepID=A0A0D0DPJ5_9AGAM|nr:hypothetical protein PAXRUDRAFT_820995 [Paxillus rubicundulus Ve08.2h10]